MLSFDVPLSVRASEIFSADFLVRATTQPDEKERLPLPRENPAKQQRRAICRPSQGERKAKRNGGQSKPGCRRH